MLPFCTLTPPSYSTICFHSVVIHLCFSQSRYKTLPCCCYTPLSLSLFLSLHDVYIVCFCVYLHLSLSLCMMFSSCFPASILISLSTWCLHCSTSQFVISPITCCYLYMKSVLHKISQMPQKLSQPTIDDTFTLFQFYSTCCYSSPPPEMEACYFPDYHLIYKLWKHCKWFGRVMMSLYGWRTDSKRYHQTDSYPCILGLPAEDGIRCVFCWYVVHVLDV